MSRYAMVDYTNASGLEQLTRAYEHDAGFDLRASQDVTIPAGGMGIIPTGVVLGMPPPMYCRIVGRSSNLIKRGLMTYEGVIDSGFRGELFVIVWNWPKVHITNPAALPINDERLSMPDQVIIKRGEAIAQVLFHLTTSPTLTQVANVNHLQPSQRGASGFGSSGTEANNSQPTSTKLIQFCTICGIVPATILGPTGKLDFCVLCSLEVDKHE